MPQAHSKPSHVTAESGVVIMDGPGGTALTLTPAAAQETADRLKDAAEQSRHDVEDGE